MKKNVYLIILTLVTVICIVGGTCYHLVGWGVSFLSHLPFASFYSDSDDTESSGTTLSTGTVSLPSFNTVKIDSKVMNLSIEKGDDYSIQCDSTEKLNPKYEIKDITFEKLYVDGSVGDVKVSSPKDLSDYAYDLDTSIGEVSINGVSHKKEYQQKGTGGKITVDNSTGDISITY